MPDKYEKEIEELLASLGEVKPRRRKWTDRVSSSLSRWQYQWQGFVAGLSHKRINPDKLMIYGILLIVLTYFLRLPIISRYTGIAGILLFFTGFVLALTTGGGYSNERKIWRGRVIDFNDGKFGEKIRFWLKWLIKGR